MKSRSKFKSTSRLRLLTLLSDSVDVFDCFHFVYFLTRFGGDQRRGGREAIRRDRVIAAMPLRIAIRAFLLDVSELAAGGQLAVSPDYAAARQRPKPEEPHVHWSYPPFREIAKGVPRTDDIEPFTFAQIFVDSVLVSGQRHRALGSRFNVLESAS
jgi:hypothetical protein